MLGQQRQQVAQQPLTGVPGTWGAQANGNPSGSSSDRPSGDDREGAAGTAGKPKWEMPKRMSVILTLSSVVLTAISLFFGVRYILNLRFLDSYANGAYNASIPHTLTYLNFPEPYLPYHNFGCAAFMMGNYEYAAGAFSEALEHDPPHDEPYPSRECQIRINLALALTRPLKLRWSSEEERQTLIQILTTARGYLTEDGCANPEKDVFDGHSEDAEQLKKDIDKALEKLNDPQGGDEGDDSDNQDDQQDSGDDNSDSQGGQGNESEDRLKDKLNDRKSDAMQDRAEEQQTWEDLQNMGSGSSGGGSSGGNGGASGGSSGRTW